MNGVLSEVDTWRPRRWVLGLLAALAGQIALLWFFAERTDFTRPVAALGTRVHYLPGNETVSLPRPFLEHLDPTIFALVSSRGFSGPAWLTVPQFHYAMKNPLAPPHWLGPPSDELVDDYDAFVQNNLRSEELISTKLDPALSVPQVPTPVVIAGTELRVEGDLAQFQVLPGDALPQQAEPILPNTVVRVRVDQGGRTLSAALLTSCGVAAADQQALRFAKGVRFTLPRPTQAKEKSYAPSAWFGDLVFRWHRYRWGNSGPAGGQP